MLILASPSDLIQVTLSTTNGVVVHASYVDWNGARSTPGRTNTNVVTTSITTIVPAPAAGIYRNVKYLSLVCGNTGGNTLNISHTDGTTSVSLFQVSCPQYGTCTFTEGKSWQVYISGLLVAMQGF
jgi:hypothetical protein